MIRQVELCEKWGPDPGQVSRMVKAGMPLTSEADALKWRLANQKKVFTKAPPIATESEDYESPAISDENISALNTLGTYRDWETDRKSTRLNSIHSRASRMPSSA